MNNFRARIADNLYEVWIIASKDIVDALKNKLILSLMIGVAVMLLMPKAMRMMLVSPVTSVVVYDQGESQLTRDWEAGDQVQVQRVNSAQDLEDVVGETGFSPGTEFGLKIPANFDLTLAAGGQPELEGYVSWANRGKAEGFKTEFEGQIEAALGRAVNINLEGNIVYPHTSSTVWLLMVTVIPVTVILMMGINLVPSLLFEEKETKTMEALLVSPASISQVVVGKALAGLFYSIASASVVLIINWQGVVHWDVALLFMLMIGVFGVGVGLVLGSYFEHQKDMVGLSMILLMVFIGAMIADMVGLEVPAAVEWVLTWVPSVALADVLRYVFLENVSWTDVWLKMGSVLVISIPLYLLVVWKLRTVDR